MSDPWERRRSAGMPEPARRRRSQHVALAAPVLCCLLASATGAQPVRLTSHPADDRHPAFSPDGGRLLFESNRDGSWEIYLMDAAGGAAERLTDHPAADRFPAWGPAGERIVFQSDRGGRPELYLLAGSAVTPLGVGGGPEMVPHFSPDGSAIAYTAERDGNVDLYLLHLGSREVRRLTRDPRRDVWPRFSPDGEQLTFFSRRDTGGADDELYVMPAAGGPARRITTKPGHDFCPAFSPDGRWLAAASRDAAGARFIAVFDLGGELRVRLGEGFERATHPSWSADGRSIAFAARGGEQRYDLYVEEVPPLPANLPPH